MRFLSARSSVIAQNIANADSPGYQAKDIREADFRKLVSQSTNMHASDPKHITATNQVTSQTRSTGSISSADGGSTSIETETMKLSQTRMEYGLASTVYRKGLNMLRLAIRSDR